MINSKHENREFPLFSIVIAAYNRLPLLKEAVISALDQSLKNSEVLVIDDGSDEETKAWLIGKSHKVDRMRVIHQKHQGIPSARQAGLIEARGKLVCILDSDDRLFPKALEKIHSVFERNPEVALVYTNILQNYGGRRIKKVFYPHFRNNREMIRAILIRAKVPFKHSGTTYIRDLALRVGGYDRNLPLKIDIDLFLKFLIAGYRLILLDDQLVEFKFHKNSASGKRITGLGAWWRLIRRYGPSNRLGQLYIFGVRSCGELAKLIYAKIFFHTY